jgi:hypothetical protein
MEHQLKLLTLLLVALAVFAWADTSVAQVSETQNSTAVLEKRIADLEVRLEAMAKLEARVKLLEKSLSTIRSRQRSEISANRIKAPKTSSGNSPLVLDDWNFSTIKGDFGQNYYNITLNLRNKGTKTIKLIEGSVQFYDLLDEKLYGIRITPDALIGAGATKIDVGQYSINQFMNEQKRMASMNKADIKPKLIISRIVFTDNTVLKVSR